MDIFDILFILLLLLLLLLLIKCFIGGTLEFIVRLCTRLLEHRVRHGHMLRRGKVYVFLSLLFRRGALCPIRIGIVKVIQLRLIQFLILFSLYLNHALSLLRLKLLYHLRTPINSFLDGPRPEYLINDDLIGLLTYKLPRPCAPEHVFIDPPLLL